MKTIGLIGGMSWESSSTYYSIINETIKKELGGLHSSKCILYSVDFQEIETCQINSEWDKAGEILAYAGKSLEKAGADFIIICTNTMHKVADRIKASINIPILHIAEMTALELKKSNITTVGLLGTKYTMEQDFYKNILIDSGINVLIPEKNDIEIVNTIIFNELCLGVISDKSKDEYLRIIDNLKSRGAQGAILGCTEIGLLINQNDTDLPLFDTALIHARNAALKSLEK